MSTFLVNLDPKQIGARVKELREAQDLSQSAFATRIGLTQAAISQIESGDRTPSTTSLAKIAKGFGLTADALLHASSGTCRRSSQLSFIPEDADWAAVEDALKAWGTDRELMMVAGECGELLAHIGKVAQGRVDTDEFAAEVADVTIMMASMANILGRDIVSEKIHEKLTKLRAKLDREKLNKPSK